MAAKRDTEDTGIDSIDSARKELGKVRCGHPGIQSRKLAFVNQLFEFPPRDIP